MPSERTQRQIDRLLDEAEQAMAQRDWASLREHAQDVLLLDTGNEDAQNFLRAAERALASDPTPPEPILLAPFLRREGGTRFQAPTNTGSRSPIRRGAVDVMLS